MRFPLLPFLLAQSPLTPPSSSSCPSPSPLPSPPLSSSPTIPSVNITIIGAGLSGLTTAHRLLQASRQENLNLSILILEADSRIGGRVADQVLQNGAVTELGGAYIGPTQKAILGLISELGLETFAQPEKGDLVSFLGGQRRQFSAGEGVTGWGEGVDREILGVIEELNERVAGIVPGRAWEHARAGEWDGVVFGEWLDERLGKGRVGRGWFETVFEGIFSVGIGEVSLLYVLAYIASTGDGERAGTWDRLVGASGEGPDVRVEGGAGQITSRLAEEIGWQNIWLDATVGKVEKVQEDRYRLSCADGREVLTEKVVVAMSPPLAARMTFDPNLPARQERLMQGMFMGSVGKVTAIYEKPFWRENGVLGLVTSDLGMVRVTLDASPAHGEYGAIVGLLEARQARAADALDAEEVQRIVRRDLFKYFGERANHVREWVIVRWDNEHFSKGGPFAVMRPGILSKYGPTLAKPVGGIYRAGAEMAGKWIGYMDGAVESGRRTAVEILRDVKIQDRNS